MGVADAAHLAFAEQSQAEFVKEVVVPPLGQTTDTVTLVAWYKQEGEVVKEGEPLFAIETDKATLDVEAQASGVLRNVTAAEGQAVPVLSAIGLIAAPDEGTLQPEAAQKPRPALASVPFLAAPPAADRRREAKAGRVFISPRARRLAEAHGVDLRDLSATGPESAIVERDVRAYLERRTVAVTGPALQYAASAVRSGRLSAPGERSLAWPPGQAAEQMAQGPWPTARATLTAEADASALVVLCRRLAEDGIVVSYSDLFLYVLGRALREQPALNVSLEGGILRQWKRVHIGLAVPTDRGLLAPVVRDVESKGLGQLAQETRELLERAEAGTLTPDELQGGTFTLANLGTFGVDTFTPIAGLSEAGVLGVGRIKARPAVWNNEVATRDMVWLSLTFDQRLADGGAAARFLQRVVQLIEHPHLLYA
jgi:pyruvate dehydrogenase E2 component (dihydrolipoamide acetyltransferase)